MSEHSEVTITVMGWNMSPAQAEAMFDRIADAVHALNEEVTCSMSLRRGEDA